MRDHRFADEAYPLIVAHRGASSTRPENTLAAFEEAIRLGAPVVELDVRLSRDGRAVVMHDATVDRTTDGTGAVHELSAAELGSLNAGTADAPERVPVLADALDMLSGRAGVALEIKNLPGEPAFETDGESLVRATHAELERTAFEGPVLVVSFNPASVAASKAIAPEVPTGFLVFEPVTPPEALAHAVAAGHDMVLPSSRDLVREEETYVSGAHDAGVRVGTWTVDDEPTMEKLFGWGVDAVASNRPALAVAVRDRVSGG
jgi:glycerophosphoryl diester phosphodiesterase